MHFTADSIHKKLITEYPQDAGGVRAPNLGRNHRPLRSNTRYLYILDTSRPDPYSNSIRHYETDLENELRGRPFVIVKCLPYPFYGYEVDEAKKTLEDLANMLGVINFDVEDSFARLHIEPNNDQRIFFIVITVAGYEFLEVDL